jgi:hypothetical protein
MKHYIAAKTRNCEFRTTNVDGKDMHSSIMHARLVETSKKLCALAFGAYNRRPKIRKECLGKTAPVDEQQNN